MTKLLLFVLCIVAVVCMAASVARVSMSNASPHHWKAPSSQQAGPHHWNSPHHW